MKAILIAGNQNTTAMCQVNTTTKKFKLIETPQVVENNITGVTRINALSALVRYMDLLNNQNNKTNQEQTYKEPIIIYSIQMLTDFIFNKTALYWLANDGKKNDGSQASLIELDLWKEFFNLISKLETEIIFKDISEAKINPMSKYKTTEDKRIINSYLSQTWELVNSKKEVYEQIDEEAFI